ncbi:alpha/beta hydrolase-fold protein [Gaetbulibacter aquiaggeris]|uniref:Alpha/beta hydrolase-fold protein n=1 Tax=Gaetbulibacter aquiaggeris TaxID=1735373 RepID=A0ABW7MLX3_9FLAO
MIKNFLFFLMVCTAMSQNVDRITSNKVSNINLFGGELIHIENFPSKFIQPRNIDVWIPNNYRKSKKYAVLYMQDGQMLFDSTTTWNKQEWKVDEIASLLMNEGQTKDFIVVAIWNIAALRNSNYFPEKVYEMMSEKDKDSLIETGKKQNWINTINSNNYLRFVVEELKPYIDSHFSTYTDADNTSIMGSSRGGLISMYAISEYPEVFGSAACLSTHWIGTYNNKDNQIPDAFFEYMRTNLPDSKTHNIYFDYGTETLDEQYLKYQDEVSKLLASKGYTTNLKFDGADHSENSWGQRLEIPLMYLFGNKRE